MTSGISSGMTTGMVRSAALPREDLPLGEAATSAGKGERSVLAQLLHALNQPLTGLQCSMEVALASPRTAEHYVRTLRDGLELTARMRNLVEAIREVTDVTDADEKETNEEENSESIELKSILQEVVDDLAPVAEVKRVRIALHCPVPSAFQIKGSARSAVRVAVFRMVESALSCTAGETVLHISTEDVNGISAEEVNDAKDGVKDDAKDDAKSPPAEVVLRLHWNAGLPPGTDSRADLGLLVAQASWERMGARWVRERTRTTETVNIRIPGVSPTGNFSLLFHSAT